MRELSADPTRPNETGDDLEDPAHVHVRPVMLGEQYLRPDEGTITRAQYLERAA